MRPIRAGDPDGVPGPVRIARPAADRVRPGRRAADDPRPGRRTGRATARGARRAERCRTAPGGRHRATLSAPPVGRPAAARGDRGRDGAGSGRHRGRRADVDARRVAPRRDPAADARPARAASGLVPVHHARPLARVGRGRPDRGRVPRPDRGDRPGGRGHREPQAPVHESPGLGDPRAGGGRGRRPARAGRRDAVGAQRPARLPVPSAMLALRGARTARGLHDDRPARRHRRGRRPARGRVPFPAGRTPRNIDRRRLHP